MPKRKRHLPGKYQAKSELRPNFAGPKPLTLFQAQNGLWGAKDGVEHIVIEPKYIRTEQTDHDKEQKAVRLVSQFEVIDITSYQK